ncbi:transposase [Candidatus Vondammii sp. HM_W22]|uniref:transposase n=1 Tax=Candidatus Vondammii sp. HM_W22 TaxID=2687299 RepID=UPI00403D6936
MFKVLHLQHLFNLNDDQTEFQIRDRYGFCRFFGLSGTRCQNGLGVSWAPERMINSFQSC